LLVTKTPENFSNKKIIIMKKETLLPLLFFYSFATNTGFAQITSQKIDSLMEDALAKFKVAEQQ
jgi:hypothetical protein